MKHDNPDNPGTDAAEPVSKSQRKRDAKALFLLGRELAGLPESAFRDLDMDERLREALVEARGMRSNVARKRQLGFVARLLRLSDVTPLQQALDARNNAARVDTAQQHRVELWRDGLVGDDGDAGLTELLRLRRDAEPQPLRQLVRNARREAAAGRPPASSRKLFKVLRELDQADSLPPWPGA